MTEKKCAFGGGAQNIFEEDPSLGPVRATRWPAAGDEGQEHNEKPAREGPGGAQEVPE